MRSEDIEKFWEESVSKELNENKKESGEKYKRVLNAAIKIFSKRGFAGSRTSEIAKEADVAEGTIFRYFPKKEDILMEMIIPLVIKFYRPILLEKNRKILEKSKKESITELLETIFKERYHLIDENMDILKILCIEALYNKDIRTLFTEKISEDILNLGLGVVEAQKEQGEVRDIESKQILRAGMSMLIGYILLNRFVPSFFKSEPEEDFKVLVDILINGIGSKKETKSEK
ncbi:MAG: TetR/AcrR family transcriptional regulator [Fusobacteria bacterium]|nr:TetR/AcrR family transcriptional regulator [Fusobacteriota bacterium]